MVNVIVGVLLGLALLGLTGYYILMVGKMIFFIGELVWDSVKMTSSNKLLEPKGQTVTTQ
jgi:membrane protein implicated in regulation of membrane protease activity